MGRVAVYGGARHTVLLSITKYYGARGRVARAPACAVARGHVAARAPAAAAAHAGTQRLAVS